jgi:protein kinase-like protein
MALAPGTALGPYELVSLLGAGGTGEVYRAHDPRLRRDVAIKVIARALAGDATTVDRFIREALSASALNHPNVVTIYETGETPHGRYMYRPRTVGRLHGIVGYPGRASSGGPSRARSRHGSV